ncbi:transcription factor RelB homolog isoform X2 [Paramormyrops kingsleyae]|nr:transcription factor RelB isoform X2 [Paramormyrops kingsleyae]XP_023669485.1 transcription factor RelB isoform X2 [Paramormyrops kingsleyae]XP_023669486.1 transcription factor RelB isoform X2 [Paramormyrops kingsleyae]XP_023669487.1 transcription factor RelB isoform X2 [Paramormyrops kingsleyae]
MSATPVLPRSPQVPQTSRLNSAAPSRARRAQPVLVARGTGPQLMFPICQSSPDAMASPISKHGSMSSAIQASVPNRMGTVHGGTDLLEKFLEIPKCSIVEQPKERGMRFRYECEGRSAGSILGAGSTEANKSLPAIEIRGNLRQVKKVKITVSLVTKDIPHRPHPHSLVGKDCNDGICVVNLNLRTQPKHSFANLGIQCVRRKELDAALERRRKQKIDPFNTDHSKSIEDIDMNVVRLCFQCELEKEDGEKVQLSPVVSNPIYDKKATTTSELKINRLNVLQGPCTGKTEIYLLCDKVQKDDIEIIFSRDKWEAKAEFAQTDVHRQIAIVFKSPPYQERDITEEVEVDVCLRRLSDHMSSEPVKFTYLPHNPDPYEVNRKRKIKPDISFKDGCRVTTQHQAIPEPTNHQFDYSFLTAEPSYSVADLTGASTSQSSPDLKDIHYSPSLDSKREDISAEDFQNILRMISSMDDSGIVMPSVTMALDCESQQLQQLQQQQQQQRMFPDVGHHAEPMPLDLENMNLLNMDQTFMENQLDPDYYNDVYVYNQGRSQQAFLPDLVGSNSQALCTFDNDGLNHVKAETHTDL